MSQVFKEDVREFMTRLVTIENEMDILKDDRKELFEDFKDKRSHFVLRSVFTRSGSTM